MYMNNHVHRARYRKKERSSKEYNVMYLTCMRAMACMEGLLASTPPST